MRSPFSALHYVEARIKEIVHGELAPLEQQVKKMAADMDALKAATSRNSDLIGSAVTLINGLADRIESAGTDPAKLQEIVAEMRNQDDALAQAIIVGTNALNPLPPPPPPTDGEGTDSGGSAQVGQPQAEQQQGGSGG
jgi:hypothetical protein